MVCPAGNSADSQQPHWLSWKTSQGRKEETQLNSHGDTRLSPGPRESLAQELKDFQTFGQSWFTFGWTQPSGENPIACGSVRALWWVSHEILFCVAFVFLENNNWQCLWCNISKKALFKTEIWDWPDGPVVKNPPSNAGDTCLIPGWETKIPHAWSN